MYIYIYTYIHIKLYSVPSTAALHSTPTSPTRASPSGLPI